MATTVSDCGNVRIVTQVIQQTGPQAEAAADNAPGSPSMTAQLTPAQIKHFNNTLSKALGVVEIVLGATQISFGFALALAQGFKSLPMISGVYFWNGILLLFSGSLLVEMEKRELQWLVKACFFANLVVLIAALAAVILHATDILQEVKKGDPCTSEDFDSYYCNYTGQKMSYGLNSVFIIFSLLEVSIAVTAMVTTFKYTRQQLYQQMVL